jgi:hypothetical protein
MWQFFCGSFIFNISLIKLFYSTEQCFIFQECDLPTGIWNLSDRDLALLGSSVSLTLKLCSVMHSACTRRIFFVLFFDFLAFCISLVFWTFLTLCTFVNSRWSSKGKMLLPLSNFCFLVKIQIFHHLFWKILFSVPVAWELCCYFIFLDVLKPSAKL